MSSPNHPMTQRKRQRNQIYFSKIQREALEKCFEIFDFVTKSRAIRINISEPTDDEPYTYINFLNGIIGILNIYI
jgi:hypothetical protein